MSPDPHGAPPIEPPRPVGAPWGARAALAAILLASAALTLRWAWLPLEKLVGAFTADDMFYYLQISDNLRAGRGATFDGEVLTNGFHPAWMAAVTVVGALVSDPALRVHLSLTLLAGCVLLGGWGIHRVVSRLVGPPWGLVGAAAWCLSPWVAAVALSGVEAALAAAVALADLALFTWWLRAERGALPRRSLAIGGVLGLAGLARTDLVLLGAAQGLVMLAWTVRRHGWGRVFAVVGPVLLGGVAMLAPWLGWNLAVFGRISQDSFRALRWRQESQAPGLGAWARESGQSAVSWLTELGQLAWGLPWGAVAVALVVLAVAAWWFRRRRPGIAAVLAVGLLHQLFALAFYAGFFHYRQHWYLLAPSATFTLSLALALGALWPRRWAQRGVLAAVLLVVALLFSQAPRAIVLDREGVYPWQSAYLELGQQVIPSLGPDARVAAFNAGMMGYFAAEQGVARQVVNLDGVVSGEALEAMQQARLLDYLRQRGVTHLVDHERAIREAVEVAEPAYATAFDLLAQRPVACSGGPIFILRLKE